MGNFLQQISNLITSSPGNLTYHLVLTFSLTGALVACLLQRNAASTETERRTTLGLSLLLALRVAMFIVAGLSWQALLNEHLVQPPIDRAVTLLSLLVVIWLWAFPRSSRLGDAASLLLGLLLLIFSVFSIVWWLGKGNQLSYNHSLADQVAQYVAIALLSLGCIYLVFRRPLAWGFGFGMGLTLLTGHIANLFELPPGGDYSAAIRLTQMAAFPLLLALPLRFPPILPARQTAIAPAFREHTLPGSDPRLIQLLLSLNSEQNPATIGRIITQAISSAVPAEICLLILPPDENDRLNVYCGYDQVRERHLEGFTTTSQNLPAVTAAIQEGISQTLAPDSLAPDTGTLSQALKMTQTGYLHVEPVFRESGEPLAGIILLSPYSRRGWKLAEIETLRNLLPPVAQLLQRTNGLAQLQTELEKTREELQKALRFVEEEGERENYQEQLVEQQWMKPDLTMGVDATYLEGELRLALEEIARLKGALSEADRQLLDMQNQMEGIPLLSNQHQAFVSILQELRQTMSTVMGYTDFLLTESVGILGSLQRKFLERVRISIERMNRLVEELMHMASLKSGGRLIKFETVDLNELIQEAIASADDLYREKNLNLKLDLPQDNLYLQTDRVALQQALVHLLENAGEITPAGEQVCVRAKEQHDDQQRKFILIQVTDKGGGIPVADIPRVFSRLARRDQAPIPGVRSDHTSLYIVKRLVDTLQGRIWVDTEHGIGSTFSLLLPAEPEPTAETSPGDLIE